MRGRRRKFFQAARKSQIAPKLDHPCPYRWNEKGANAAPGRKGRKPVETSSNDGGHERHNPEARDQQSTKGPRAFQCQIVRHNAAQLLGLHGGGGEGNNRMHARSRLPRYRRCR